MQTKTDPRTRVDPPDKVPKTLSDIYTPYGRGRVVYVLPDKSVLVEFPEGHGVVFQPYELGQALGQRGL